MKKITYLLFLFLSSLNFAQIKGKITDTNNKPLSFVSIYLDKSVTGTTSNDNGDYVLEINKKGIYTINFQYLGYKTLKKKVQITNLPFVLNVQLLEEKIQLDEFSISTNENPANKIIRNTIANKDKNTDKFANYTAQFYSRGLYRIKDAPEKFLGKSLGDFGGNLDSTRSGIVYLSETISQVSYQKKPKKFKEHIIASKVSGRDNGISFNRAEDANINFYSNSIEFGNFLVSPISTNAFNYYNYKLAGTFYDKNGKLINKIIIIPKRKNDAVFEGALYIVEDDWALYGADVVVSGKQVNIPLVDYLTLKQNYNYSESNDAWVLISQSIDFKVNAFGFKFDGRFSSAYSNYIFSPDFTKNTFTNEVLSFSKKATEKDTAYWNNLRPVPLTKEEVNDYKIKDSIKTVRKSKPYLDSINKKQNTFNPLSPITGYTYRDSYKKWAISFNGFVDKFSFNTVQGFHTTLNTTYHKQQNNKGKRWSVGLDVDYGFSEKKARPTLYFSKKWNNISKPKMFIAGGVTTAQFNRRNPIKELDNLIRSLTRRLNYMKIYEKKFIKVGYSEELINGIRFSSSLEYTHRKPLFNTTNYSFARQSKNKPYTSNNPLEPLNYGSSPFVAHKIGTFNIGATFVFDQKYLSYPNRKVNLKESKYPTLSINYRKTFGAENNEFNADLFTASLKQEKNTGNYGKLFYFLRAGAFLKQKDIAIMDNLQVKGNLMFIVTDKNRKNNFGLLEYYRFLSNDKYAEGHLEHNFKGAVLGKIPLVNKLNFHLITGAKTMFMADTKPYSEYTIGLENIGFGKWRFMRLDYIQSFHASSRKNGLLMGLHFSF